MSTQTKLQSGHVEIEIRLAVSREKAWAALIDDIAEWWPRDFYVTKAPKFILEPKVGGRAYEDTGNGTGALWFQITSILPPQQLDLQGHIAPPFGGPCTSLLSIRLEEDGENTIFRLSDHLFGVVPDTATTNIDEGWRQIFEKNFKEYVER